MPRPLRCTQAEHDMASMRSLRAPCVPSLCAHFGSLLCVPALRTPVYPYCVHGVLVQFVVDMCARAHTCCAGPCGVCSSCAPSCWACQCGVLVQRSTRSCDIRSSTSSTSRGCTGPCFVLALCMLALSYLCPPCSRCVYLLCMRLLCMLAVCALALPMLALRAPAVPVLAVRACAVRFRAVCGVLVQRSYTWCGDRRPCIPVDPGDLP